MFEDAKRRSGLARWTCAAAIALGLMVSAASVRAVESPTSSGEVATVDTPIVRVPMLGKPPTIDGTIGEGEWQEASGLSGFWYDYGNADFRFLAAPQTQLQVYLGYDKENLYIAYVSPVYPEKSWFKAQGRFPDVVHHPLYGVLWDDHVELELRPTPDNVRGFQMGLLKWVINPIGTICDQHWSPKSIPGYAWKSDMTVRSTVTDKKWTLEMSIPFKSLAPGDYAGKEADGQPIVKTPPPDGASYRAWFTRAIGGNGDFFNAFDKHVWNTTKTRLVFDSAAPAFQINDLGPIMEDNVDLQVTLSNRGTRSETVRLGFFVESPAGLVYSSYDAPELKDGLLELLPGEVKKMRLKHSLPGVARDGNVLWFDVRSAGSPAKVLFRTRLIDFHTMEGGAADKMSFRERRVDVVQKLRPPRKDFDFRYDFSAYRKRLAAVVDIGITGGSEDAKRAKEAKVSVVTADKNETVIAEKRVQFKGDFAIAEIDLPNLTPGEKYKASALLFDENKRIVGEASPPPFAYNNEPWMGNKLGTDDVVWEPFEPIKPFDKGFETLKHRFTLDASGLPAQIEIKPDPRDLPLDKRAAGGATDADLRRVGRGTQLRAPMRLEAEVGGQRVPAQVVAPAKAIRTGKSEIEYESKLKVGPADVTLRTRYDCDGSMHVSMTYGAGASAQVDKLELVADYAGHFDMAFGTMHGGGMQGPDNWECTLPMQDGVLWDSGKQEPPELYYSKFVPWFFLGSGDRGFTWYCDNDRSWLIDKAGTTMTVERDKAMNVTWRARFVNYKADLKGSRTIDFTILTHPSKPKPKDFRKLAWFYRGDTWAANYRMEPIDLSEDYLKARLRETTGAPKEVTAEQLATYKKETAPWYRYGRLRNEGVWPNMDKNWEDKAVYFMERQIRVGRRVGLWWDEYWPGYRTDNLAEGDAYPRDPAQVEKNELPWQSGYVTNYMRNTFKRMARIHATSDVPLRHFFWANNSATMLESFGWDTQLVEECGAMHRSYELDILAQYPASLFRYMSHSYTGLVCRIVADAGLVPAGDDPRLERQIYGRALVNDIGVTGNGPHGRMQNPDIAIKLLKSMTDFGVFNDADTEVIPYWRSSDLVRYGQVFDAQGRFNEGVENPVGKVYVTAYRRPHVVGNRKGYKVMLVVLNEATVPLREQLYLPDPAKLLGGPNAQTVAEALKAVDFAGIPEDSDWRQAQSLNTGNTKPTCLIDLETRGIIAEAENKDKNAQVYGPVFIQPRDFRVLYGFGLSK